MSQQHHAILIVGGGVAGVSVANNMRRQNASIELPLLNHLKSIITSQASPLSAAALIP